VVVIALLLLLVSLVSVDLHGRLRQVRADRDATRFARTLRLAAEEAILRRQSLVVVIEVYDGYYTVYEANAKNEYYDAEPLLPRASLDHYWIDQIEFDDGSQQYSGEVIITVGPEGFPSSLLFHLVDRDDRRMYVRCDRFTPRVVWAAQPLEMPEVRAAVSPGAVL